MDNIGICGHFGFGHNFFDGQTIKTRIFAEEIERVFGKNRVNLLDTCNWKGNPFDVLIKSFQLIRTCEKIIILPGQNGLRFFIPYFLLLNRFYCRKIHYVVIGGWLPNEVKKDKRLQKNLKKLNGIYVETNSMLISLKDYGLDNVVIMPNFKQLDIIDEKDLKYNWIEPYKLCTFSRVLKEKGIEDAIDAVKKVNTYYNRIVYTLDIYGQVDESYSTVFEKLKTEFPEYISYKGIVNYDDSTKVLKEYFALLFPTYYSGEGFAGTLLDAFSAGLPVIATDWKYNSEIISNKVEGILYDFRDKNKLESILKNIIEQPEIILNMKVNCIKRARQYTPNIVIGNFIRFI